MTLKEIANRRRQAQLLTGGGAVSAPDVVKHMGAMQAQDFAMSKWAVGVRSGLSEAEVTAEIDAGGIIRTHAMRPTWHLVHAADVRWMLALTSPGVKRAYMTYGKKLGMDEKVLSAYNKKIVRLLAKGKPMTRDEIMQALRVDKHNENDYRPSLIMMHAEQEAVVCNGPMKGKDITYVLMDTRVPAGEQLTREEALARLAFTYFNSHGPATVADFAWWSGLGVTDARRGAQSVNGHLECVTTGGLTWYFTDHGLPKKKAVQLLPAFDEYLVSYKDREASIASAHQPHAITKNGIFKPVIVDGGNVVGTWKREVKGNKALVEISCFAKLTAVQSKDLIHTCAVFGCFLGREVIFRHL